MSGIGSNPGLKVCSQGIKWMDCTGYPQLRQRSFKRMMPKKIVPLAHMCPTICSFKPEVRPILRSERQQIGREACFATNAKSRLC
jgi:hypothetical protein